MRKRFKPGISFGDFVIQDSSMSRSRIEDDTPRDFRRGWLVWLVVVASLGLIFVRLVSLQVIGGGKYRILADENRIKTIKLPAPRGKILDRNGLVLAGNLDSGVRQYPHGESAAHVIGYLGEVSENEVGLLKEKGEKYDPGDIIGRSGIESEYEKLLRGTDGGKLVEVDSAGKDARELGILKPLSGMDLKLNLDAGLQDTAFSALGDKKGAVVATDPGTGRILAIVSAPSFDPNTLSTQYSVLSTLPDLPLFNRAIGGVYPPGSTFKMVTTTAALDSGKVKPDFVYEDQGVITVGSYSYFNWLYSRNHGTEGVVNFSRAISRSTDTFFYKIGELTGPQEIADKARTFGLGKITGIDLAGEVAGLIPDPDWKKQVKDESWFLGDTYIMAIGQGDILVTPVQLNQMTNILATGGYKCKPNLLDDTSLSNPPPNLGGGRQGVVCPKIEISSETLEIIKKGMTGACNPGGTGFVFFDWNEAAGQSKSKSMYSDGGDRPLPIVACKTGTAEYVAENGKTRTHGLFTAFAPADNPQISVTVVMEGGGEGSNVAAPIARKVMAKYFGITDTYPYGAIRQVSE